MQLVIEFIFKFIEGSTCLERHTAHRQELQTAFAASGLYIHVVTGRCPAAGQRPITTWVYKPEAATTVKAPDDERYAARNMLSLQ